MPHYLWVSVNSISPLLLADDDQRSKEELEKLAATNLQNIIYRADIELLRKWLPIICSAVKTGKMGEAVIVGYSQYAIGDHEGLKATIRLLESSFPDEHLKEVFDYESRLLRMRFEFVMGNFTKIDQLFDELPSVTSFPFNRTNAENFSKHRTSLVSSFYMQDKEKFQKHYSQIEQYMGTEFGTIPHLNLNTFKSMNAFMHGRYLEANEYALAAINLSNELEADGAYAPYEAAYVLADTYLEFGEEAKSAQVTEKYLEKAIKFNQYPWITAFYAKLAILKIQQGNVSGALAAIRQGRESVESSIFNSFLSFTLDVHELLIRMQLDDMERINELIPRIPNVQTAEGFKMAIQMQKNPANVASFIHLFPENNDQEKFRKEMTFALINIQNRPVSIQHLEKAIELAIPNGYFRSFLLMPPELKSYLLDITTKKQSVFGEKLARAIRAQSAQMSSAPKTDMTPLTKRELDVLRRLGTNIPITKIAASLHISNNTIKTHLKNVYRKLNVESRDEAVARGKELSLL